MEKKYYFMEYLQETNPLSQAIVTSVNGLVEAQQYMFENLWNKSIPAEQKIKEIEQGIKPDIIETITDPIKIQESVSKPNKISYNRNNADYSYRQMQYTFKLILEYCNY